MKPGPDEAPVRRARLEQRERWLLGNIGELRQSIRRAPYMLLGLLAVPLVGWRWGFAAAGLVAFVVLTLVGATLYVAWSHVQEYEGELLFLRRKLKALDEGEGSAPPTPTEGPTP